MATLYDTIGNTYTLKRRPDPRIAAQIRRAIGEANTLVNIGAGSGSYEPEDVAITAVEPSAVMIAQRPQNGTPVVQANAESLPFADNSFDVATAFLTLHHWQNQAQGLAEMKRVARDRVVIFTIDLDASYFWLLDYFPEIRALDQRIFPTIDQISKRLGTVECTPVFVPQDCVDGFLGAYWRRPEAYLDPAVRSSTSAFKLIGDHAAGLSRLTADLKSGAWQQAYGDLLDKDTLDIGYRILTRHLEDAE